MSNINNNVNYVFFTYYWHNHVRCYTGRHKFPGIAHRSRLIPIVKTAHRTENTCFSELLTHTWLAIVIEGNGIKNH